MWWNPCFLACGLAGLLIATRVPVDPQGTSPDSSLTQEVSGPTVAQSGLGSNYYGLIPCRRRRPGVRPKSGDAEKESAE